MKKSLLTLFATALCFCNLLAQDRMIDSVGSNGFHGFKSLERGMFYYTYYFSDKAEKNGMTTLVVPFLSESLIEENKLKLELPAGTEVLSSASNGMVFFFVLGDEKKKTITYMVTDRMGKDIKKKVIDHVPASQFTSEFRPKGYTVLPEHVLLIQPRADKKGGYEVECLDRQLASVWKKTYTPEKGSWEMAYCDVAMDKLYVIRKETNSGKFKFVLHGIQANTGNDVCNTEYLKDGDYGAIDFVSIGEGDMLKAGGYYYSGGNLSNKPEGIFAAITDPTGNFVQFHKQAFKDLPDSVKNTPTGRFIMDGSLKLMVQDIIQTHGGQGYIVIAEAYRDATADELKGITGKTKGITLSNFIFLSYSRENELQQVNISEKEPMTASVSGKLADEESAIVANWLRKKGFFCYRSFTIEREKPIIVYKNYNVDRFKVFFLPIDVKTEKMAALFDIGAMPDPKAKDAKPLKYISFNSDAVKETPETNPMMSQEIMPSKPGFVVLYFYLPPRIAMTQKPITAY